MKLRYLLGSCILLVVSTAYGSDRPNYEEYATAPVMVASGSHTTPVYVPGRISSMDERRGVPTFIWANQARVAMTPHKTPEAAARWYLSQFSDLYHLPRAAFDTMYVSNVFDLQRGGMIVVFRQRVDGVEVVKNALKFLMKSDYTLVAVSGSLHDKATPQTVSFGLTPEQALASAFGDLYGISVQSSRVQDLGFTRAGYGHYNIEPHAAMAQQQLALTEPSRVKRVLYPMPGHLVPGYLIEIQAGRTDSQAGDVYAYIIAADDGRVVMRSDLVHDDTFNYRVFADTTGLLTPRDGPVNEFTPHPTGLPDGFDPGFAAPQLVPMEAFNTNPSGGVDPWLPSGAVDSNGNNVDAYADITGGDGFDGTDIRAATSATGTFDYIYDPLVGPQVSNDQIMAAVIDLFYVTNWLHDYYYDSGFTEAAGNAQNDNFGRGGVDADSMRAEGQDAAGRNNANMSTPLDGSRPRMQMFVWDGRSQLGVQAQAPLDQGFAAGSAAFGLQTFDRTLPAVLVDDAIDDGTDACEPLVNSAEVNGNIALIDRGTCSFILKAQNAEAAGAQGVIIMNNAPGAGIINMSGTGPSAIGSLFISFEDGQTLRNALPIDVRIFRTVEPDRDGTIDNQIIAHEWGHYYHHRLQDCGTTQCRAQSEGWGDWIALHMTVREGDDYDGAYALAGYSTASLGDSFYFGIRRAPYSINQDINAFSFRHIANGEALPSHPLNTIFANNPNAEVHNAGEIWTAVLWEGYRALLGQTEEANPPYDFETAQRRMADYTTAGLLLSPSQSTFTETLDSILAAAAARDLDDFQILAQAYARRGMGTCAQSPDRFSSDFIGTVEAFEVSADMQLVNVVGLNDSLVSCDLDGVLDGGETGQMRLSISNTGAIPLLNTQVSVSSTNPNVTFPNPQSTIGSVPVFGVRTAAVDIALSDAVEGIGLTDVTIALINPNTCEGVVETQFVDFSNFDRVPSQFDTVESPVGSWVEQVDAGSALTWQRVVDFQNPGNHVWLGIDQATTTDSSNESASMSVSGNADLVLEFNHRYSFEQSDGINWDGGFIEISLDNGQTWDDVSLYASPSYSGAINVAAGRPGFAGRSPGYPAMQAEVLNIGTQLAGQTVKFRFRVMTDELVGDTGWEIDDIRVSGVNNKPFHDVIDDEGVCNGLPEAYAGLDQTVDARRPVTLDGRFSSDPNGDDLTFEWAQIDGPAIDLNSADQALATFIAPDVQEETTLTFGLTVSDGVGATMDTINVLVIPAPDTGTGPDGGTGPIDPIDDGGNVDAGCCQTGSSPGSGSIALMLLVALGLVRVTRRRRED